MPATDGMLHLLRMGGMRAQDRPPHGHNPQRLAMPAEKAGHLYNINVGFVEAVAEQTDVAEIYSPRRFMAACGIQGLRPGFAVDLTTRRPDNECWGRRD